MTTNNEWTKLPDMMAVAKAFEAEWEIQVYMGVGQWGNWGAMWDASRDYRARPRQPEMEEVAYCLWGNRFLLTNNVVFGPVDHVNLMGSAWVRIPGTEVMVEVEQK